MSVVVKEEHMVARVVDPRKANGGSRFAVNSLKQTIEATGGDYLVLQRTRVVTIVGVIQRKANRARSICPKSS